VEVEFCSLFLLESPGTHAQTSKHLPCWRQQNGGLLVLQSQYSCLWRPHLLKASWGSLNCFLFILIIINIIYWYSLVEMSRIERTKVVCSAHWGREWDAPVKTGWSCFLLTVSNCRQKTTPSPLKGKNPKKAFGTSHAFPTRFSLLILSVIL